MYSIHLSTFISNIVLNFEFPAKTSPLRLCTSNAVWHFFGIPIWYLKMVERFGTLTKGTVHTPQCTSKSKFYIIKMAKLAKILQFAEN